MWNKRKSDKNRANISSNFADAQKIKVRDYKSSGEILKSIQFENTEYYNRQKYNLYRFLTNNILAVSAASTTWVRLSAAPGKLVADESDNSEKKNSAQAKFDDLISNIYMLPKTAKIRA